MERRAAGDRDWHPVTACVCDGSNAEACCYAWFPLVRIHLTHAVGRYQVEFDFYRCLQNKCGRLGVQYVADFS